MKCTCFLLVLFATYANGISFHPKLDFGVEKPQKQAKILFTPKTDEGKDDFETLGVVCSNIGCNTTSGKQASESIAADVVVEVNIGRAKNETMKSKESDAIEDIPDVPVVIGYKGVQNDDSGGNNNDDAVNTNPLIATNLDVGFTDDAHVRTANGFVPSIGYPQIGPSSPPRGSNEDRDFQNSIWYPRNYNPAPLGGSHNPSRPPWRGSGPVYPDSRNFNNYNNYNNYRPTSPPGWTRCVCHQPNSGGGNFWRPKLTPEYQAPGASIDGKIATMN